MSWYSEVKVLRSKGIVITRGIDITDLSPGMWLMVQHEGKYHGGTLRKYENKERFYVECDKGKIPIGECTDACINLIFDRFYEC